MKRNVEPIVSWSFYFSRDSSYILAFIHDIVFFPANAWLIFKTRHAFFFFSFLFRIPCTLNFRIEITQAKMR